MLRSRRCPECGNLFMSATDGTCGECRGEVAPLVSDADIEAIRRATEAPKKGLQTVDIKALAGLGKESGMSAIGTEPVPKKTRRSRSAHAKPSGNS